MIEHKVDSMASEAYAAGDLLIPWRLVFLPGS